VRAATTSTRASAPARRRRRLAVAAKLLEREPWRLRRSGRHRRGHEVEAGLVLASSSRTDLRQLVRFAREH